MKDTLPNNDIIPTTPEELKEMTENLERNEKNENK